MQKPHINRDYWDSQMSGNGFRARMSLSLMMSPWESFLSSGVIRLLHPLEVITAGVELQPPVVHSY